MISVTMAPSASAIFDPNDAGAIVLHNAGTHNLHICMLARTLVCTYACKHACKHTRVQACTPASMQACKRIHVHSCKHASMQVCKLSMDVPMPMRAGMVDLPYSSNLLEAVLEECEWIKVQNTKTAAPGCASECAPATEEAEGMFDDSEDFVDIAEISRSLSGTSVQTCIRISEILVDCL